MRTRAQEHDAIAVIRRALTETGTLDNVPPDDKLYSTRFMPVK